MTHTKAIPQLLDSHRRQHRYLRIAVTDRCNLRCTYCMPAEGHAWQSSTQLLTFGEILRVASMLAGEGVRKIRLTGGEPLLRTGIPDLVAELRAIPGIDTVAITSNGTRLAAQAAALRGAGLDAVNISLDTLRADRFRAITRRDDHDAVLAGIAAALREGFRTVKLNMVVMRGVNDDEIEDFVSLTRDACMQVRFIEYMPFDANGWDADRLLPGAGLRARVAEKFRLHAIGTGESAVARSYAVDGHRGTLGFISSMTEHFCEGCDRLRLTADGALKICLFSEGEVNIRDLLRAGVADEDILAAVRTALAGKWRAHPGAKELVQLHNRSMIRIGG